MNVITRKGGSHYVIQTTDKSICVKCRGKLDLLCHYWGGPKRDRAFYICFTCREVYEVGKGIVQRETE